MNRASLDKRPADVARMFDDVAARYDLTNDVLSMGQDRRWRRLVHEAVAPAAGERVLDIAAGTGTSSQPFHLDGVHVVPADFSIGMLRQGKKQLPHLPFTAADAMRLPFADDAFDAVTMSFGLRNVVDPVGALREFGRVTRPGGRVVICEFSTPTHPAFRKVYSEYLMRSLPRIASRTGSNAESYVYLAESIRDWPDQQGMADRLRDAGWSRPEWRNLSGGVVALHRAVQAA
ncbi:demethylmenaquinone methyltransferase [Luteipulveratus sp. YIM 133132]|uniref:demethylmenaquinone methyltransferase n=1 Tax=Luteipulveratus flavus TaxID=3031728 RepID=UPI0023B074B6|nr:demethylmenaquinone methyltransferase [Luteipulveratus sp. YIM 133132]MDE9365097.1 demethylmenaquinone methyltransferase [Luteipulveratus sp. YIM 133132]